MITVSILKQDRDADQSELVYSSSEHTIFSLIYIHSFLKSMDKNPISVLKAKEAKKKWLG